MKIAFVGAGSVVFTKALLTDILSFPELHGATLRTTCAYPHRGARAKRETIVIYPFVA